MNNKLKKIIIIFLTFLFAIFLLNIFVREFNTNKSDITKLNILNYIPKDYEFTIISKFTNNDIKQYINENLTEKKRDELNIIKDGIISYLGFDFQEKIKDIYDNELALTFVRNESDKNDILLIFKIKKNKDINHIINIGKEFNTSDQIIKIRRNGKLNYISHIYRTKDNYIIASSDKTLINNSLKSKNSANITLSRKSIPDEINAKEIKLLSISKNPYLNSNLDLNSQIIDEIITIINIENNKIKLRSFSNNPNNIDNKIFNNQVDNIKDIIITNEYSKYQKDINFLYNDLNRIKLIDEILNKINNKILFITNNNNWVLYFKSKLTNEILIDQLNFLKNYKKEDYFLNNINYSIYINDRLEIIDNNIIYNEEKPIFILRDETNIYISNNFDDLQNISKNSTLYDKYLFINNQIKPYKYILDDTFFIKNVNNEKLVKIFNVLKNVQYFLNTELFSLEDIKINISHVIPERYETFYLESNLKIL